MRVLLLRGIVFTWVTGFACILLAQGHGSLSPAPQILYLARYRNHLGVYLTDIEQNTAQRIFTGEEFANRVPYVWSPDGTQIAIVIDREIYVMEAHGGNRHNISRHIEIDWFPAWSPDGTQIAFVSHRNGNQEIYTADLTTYTLTNLTNEVANDTLPAWSPDGDWIAFQSQRSTPHGLYLLSMSDGNLRRAADFCGNTPPVWSSDSKIVLFVSYCTGNGDIFAIHLDDNFRLQRLTQNPNDDVTPAWSTGDQQIVFVSSRDKNREIYAMNAATTEANRLTNHPAADTLPVWSADNHWLAWVSLRDTEPGIYLMDVATQQIHLLTITHYESATPLWRP